MRTRILASLVLGLGAMSVPPASAATWTIDPDHSTARFRVRHLMISHVEGRFGSVTGTIHYEADNPAKSSVEATIDAKTIDTRVEERDEHLRSADFLDVAKHPTITFRSTKVVKARNGRLELTGDLTIRGVTKSVVLQVEGPTGAITDPWGNVKAGASATTTIDRQAFGVSWNEALDAGGVVVGDDVAITIEIEMTRQK